MNLDIVNLLKGKLIGKDGEVQSDDVMTNKVVAVYFSAHWCPPCRNFTPMLTEFYNELKSMGASVEIVFCSSDQNENSFKEYYATMPWLAIPFGDQRIKKLKEAASVSGIPTLIFIEPSSGIILNGEVEGTELVYEGDMNQVLDWAL